MDSEHNISQSEDVLCIQSEGITLSWRDLQYEVEDANQGGFLNGRCTSKPRKMKKILKGISGCCPAGTLTCVMGPSGCGKSSLLDVLAGRIKARFLSGHVSINGAPINFKELKKDAAYVTQDDTLSGVLTVYENLWYAARLKLPQNMSSDDKNERISEVLSDLGLTKVRDTKVGNWAYRGVSGGERRRVSIAVELITKPSLLILDEPTSGLDSLSSRMLIELLQSMSQSNPKRTIILTIHQPSSYIFNIFDQFMLLSEGSQVFYGSPRDALTHFKKAGILLPRHSNPADIYMEAVNVSFGEESKAERMSTLSSLIEYWDGSKQKQKLADHIAEREIHSNTFISVEPRYDGLFAAQCTHHYKYNTTFWWQTGILSHRFFWSWLRDPGVFWTRLVMYVIIAVMLGTELVRMSLDQKTISERMSVLFFSVAFLVFMTVAAVPAFIEERGIFMRERANAYYSVAPYALASTFVSTPFVFIIALAFTSISYFLMNMHQTAEAFFYFMLNLFLALTTGEAIITSISAVSPSYMVGIAIGAGLYGMFMINQGFFIRADSIPGWWIWVHYIVVHKYSFEGFMVNEFVGQEFNCENTTTANATVRTCFCSYQDFNEDCIIQGEEILKSYGYENVNKWAWLGVMAAMTIIYRVIFYSFLLFFNKAKR